MLPAPTAINNSEKNVESNINILNDNSAVANGKTTKPTVSESVYGTSKEKPVYDRSGLDKVKDDLDAQSISPLSYIYETEPNDSAYTSMPMDIGTAFGTMSSSVDNDWYVLSLEAGRPYTASLKGIPEGDDYDLYIFDPNLLDFGMSFNNGNADEVINFTPATTGNYYIHADSHIIGSGSDHSYQMLIYPDDTAPDAYEPNDNMGTSKTICNNTPVNGAINIDTDEDWYEFNVDNAGKLTVTLDSIPNNCDYDVEIYDGDSNILSGSYFTDNTSEKADLLVGTGNYYVRIYSYSGSSESAYSLNVNLSTPDQYEINDSMASATEVLVDSSTFGTIDNVKDEDYFRVDIEEAEDYIVELQNIPTGKDYDLSLFDSSGNAVAYSWSSSNNDELINMSLDAGCYYIKVHSYSGFSYEQNYMLSVYKEDAVALSMPYIRASAGDTISVPVAIQNLPAEGLCSFDFAVDYDSTAMTYLDYTVDYTDPNGALVDTEQVIDVNMQCNGVLRILFLDESSTFTKPLNNEGVIVKLNFQVNTNAFDGAYDLGFCCVSLAKVSSNDVVGISHAILKNGFVMVGSYGLMSLQSNFKVLNLTPMATNAVVAGDFNSDGVFNSLDFGLLRMHMLAISIMPCFMITVDVNGDGDINALDFGYFRLRLLGMIDEFPAQEEIETGIYKVIIYKVGREPQEINAEQLRAYPGWSKELVSQKNLEDFDFYMGSTSTEIDRTLTELNCTMDKHDIITNLRKAFFLGEVAHESSYGVRTLEQFDGSSPETYFNNKYSNDYDNLGNLGGNDGELFRGSGYIQLTGRGNYQGFANYISNQDIMTEGYKLVGGDYNKPVNEVQDGEVGYIDVGKYAWEASGWYWELGSCSGENLNYLADNKDYYEVLQGINPGDEGTLGKRNICINKMYKILTGRELGLPEQ